MATKTVFVSYSSHDEDLREELERHLSPLKREGLIETWNFRSIDAGDDWHSTIDAHLESADVILLLVSASFVASDYCWNVEMKRAIQRHREGTARVIPIIVRECDWTATPLAAIQALPPGAKAVTSWRAHAKAWTEVAKGLRAILARPVERGEIEGTLPTPETATQRAQRLVADAHARQAHADRLRIEGPGAFRTETRAVFASLLHQATEIQQSTSVPLKAGEDGGKGACIVRLDPLRPGLCPITLVVVPRGTWAMPPTNHLLALRFLGGVALPQEGNIGFLNDPKKHAEATYPLQLTSEGLWAWHDAATQSDLASPALATALLKDLLQLHEDVETGKVALPPDGDE